MDAQGSTTGRCCSPAPPTAAAIRPRPARHPSERPRLLLGDRDLTERKEGVPDLHVVAQAVPECDGPTAVPPRPDGAFATERGRSRTSWTVLQPPAWR